MEQALSALDRKNIFTDTKWLYYCFCLGGGVGDLMPLYAADQKDLCLHTQAATVPCAEVFGDLGIIHSVQTCIFCTSHCSAPPAKGSPVCAICTKKFGGPKR